MERTRFKMLYLGRGPQLPGPVAAMLDGGGYSVSRPRRSRAHERVGDGIGTWIDASVTAAELAKMLASERVAGRKSSRLFAVEITVPAAERRARKGRRDRSAGPTAALSLQQLRERVGRTQGEIARRTAMTQSQLSRVEARHDHLTSTLRRYVRALGGRIEVVAHLGTARVVLKDV